MNGTVVDKVSKDASYRMVLYHKGDHYTEGFYQNKEDLERLWKVLRLYDILYTQLHNALLDKISRQKNTKFFAIQCSCKSLKIHQTKEVLSQNTTMYED